jgi:hypothetical protein
MIIIGLIIAEILKALNVLFAADVKKVTSIYWPGCFKIISID